MQLRDCIDCSSPGRAVADRARSSSNATVPYVIDGDGNCHVYVDAAADLDMAAPHRGQRQDPAALRVQRRRDAPGARATWPTRFLPAVAAELDGVELRRPTSRPRALAAGCGAATEDDWATEFLDLQLAVKVVDSLDEAIDHVAATARATAKRSSPPTWPPPTGSTARSTPPPSSSTRPPASSTARSSGSAPRSASPPRSSTPAARWASAS